MSASREKVLAAISGGVDSAVAAALLIEAGCDVLGVHMLNGLSAGAAADARRVCGLLGIELIELDVRAEFDRLAADFAAEYARGRTPNPCIACNRRVKFGRLLSEADAAGADRLATGHHARVLQFQDGPALVRGRAIHKDQSYALFGIPRQTLPRVLFPLGDMDDKALVRKIALRLGLPVHDRPDSQDVCFIPDGDYAALLAERRPEALRPGNIVNAAGDVLGRHDGYGRYTIGQRRGLGVAAGEPMYVTDIDPETATVTIGPREESLREGLSASGANWQQDVPEAFEGLIQIRYNHPGTRGEVRLTGPGAFSARFAEPVAAVAPGQAAAVYDGDILLGGGWIDSAVPAPRG